MTEEKKTSKDPYQKYKDFKWENPDQLKNGPISDESRKCRDIFCCIFFLVFLAACVFVGILGFTKGHPEYFIHVYDEDGKACGYDTGYEDYNYLYFYNVISNVKNLDLGSVINGICVKKCPSKTVDEATEPIIKLECKGTTNNTDCEVIYENYYESTPLLNKICFPIKDKEIKYNKETHTKVQIYDPDTKANFTKIVSKSEIITYPDSNGKKYILLETMEGGGSQEASSRLINWSYFSVDRLTTWISDLYVTRWAIAGSLAWSFVAAMLFLLFLRLCAGFLVFLAILIIQTGLIILAVYFKLSVDDHDDQEDKVYRNTMLAFFWIFTVLAIVWFVFIIAMCNRIRLAVALIQVTAKYINKTWSIILVPFFFFIFTILWIVYWICLSIFLYATGEFNQNSKVIASFLWDEKIRYSWWFHLFALFYVTAIISAYSQFIYSSSACIWYFTSEKGIEGHYILKSYYRGIRYHFGSLAFGSVFIALCRLIMVWFEYIKHKVESTIEKTSDSKCFKCIISCLQCCVGCIGKIMEFINKHAYIQIALKGDNFCTAAWEGFALIIKNLGRFSALTMIGSLFTSIGTIFISVASAVIGYFVITKVPEFNQELNSCVLPVVIFLIIGFIVGMITMSIFGISGDALMHSFLLDEELNKGQAKQFPELQKFMKDER